MTDPLVFDAFDLARQGRALTGSVALTRLPRLAAAVASPAGSLQYTVQGRIDGQGRPGAVLQLDGELTLKCDRCGAPLHFSLHRHVPFVFVATEAELDALPLDDDTSEATVASGATDLAVWIEDEAILSLPLSPRHAHCEPPAAVQAAKAAGAPPPGPFAALAALKRDGPTRH